MDEGTNRGTDTGAGGPRPRYDCRGWTAVLETGPQGRRIRVAGTCTLPTPGHAAGLRPRPPGIEDPRQPGINWMVLRLELDVREPSGPAPDVPTDVAVRYEEETAVPYRSVEVSGYPEVTVEHPPAPGGGSG